MARVQLQVHFFLPHVLHCGRWPLHWTFFSLQVSQARSAEAVSYAAHQGVCHMINRPFRDRRLDLFSLDVVGASTAGEAREEVGCGISGVRLANSGCDNTNQCDSRRVARLGVRLRLEKHIRWHDISLRVKVGSEMEHL